MSTLLLAIILAVQVPSSQPPTVRAPVAGSAGVSDYIVGPRDVLKVTVFGEADLSREVTVDNDGTFDFPLIGRIQAAGQTVRQIEAEIKTRLSKGLILNPSVSVDMSAYRSQAVWVNGPGVRNPARYQIAGNATLMSVLAEAGFSSNAGSYVIVFHPHPGAGSGPVNPDNPNSDQIKVSRKDLEYGRAPNLRLQDGDTIYVPKADGFFISGEVRAPGTYVIDGDINVLQALALAGGATDKAAQNRIEFQRVVDGKTVKVKAKLTDLVKAGDTIVVPRRYF